MLTLLVIVELDRIGLTELQPTATGDEVLPVGVDTVPVPGLLVLRFDGPFYTANVRSVNRKMLELVDRRPGVEVLILDATALRQLPVTVIDEVGELQRELTERGVTMWVAADTAERASHPRAGADLAGAGGGRPGPPHNGPAAADPERPSPHRAAPPWSSAGGPVMGLGSGSSHHRSQWPSSWAVAWMRASRAAFGQRTFVAQPNFSNTQITRAEMSSWPRSTPCRAQVGSAWCRLCQDSPKLSRSSGQKFADLSRAANGRSPIMWQIELTDQVTWCSNAIRTSPAQKNADSAPAQDQVIRPPRTAGATSVATVHQRTPR